MKQLENVRNAKIGDVFEHEGFKVMLVRGSCSTCGLQEYCVGIDAPCLRFVDTVLN